MECHNNNSEENCARSKLEEKPLRVTNCLEDNEAEESSNILNNIDLGMFQTDVHIQSNITNNNSHSGYDISISA